MGSPHRQELRLAQHTSGEVFLRLAADVLDWCGASRRQPLALEGIQERFLPECTQG